MTRHLVLITVLAAACGGSKPKPIGNGSSGTPAAGGLTLTATGLGDLHAETPITLDGLTKLFPDLVVANADYEHEDGTHTAFSASRGNDLVFKIDHVDGALAALTIYSPDIPTSTGLAVGQPFAAARTALGDGTQCYGMVEEEGGNAFCTAPGGAFGVIVPIVGEHTGDSYDAGIPPEQLEALLGSSKVDRVVWIPPSPDEGRD